MNIYVASSWRNEFYKDVREKLIIEGFDVHDFKDEKCQFHWSELDPKWVDWSVADSIDFIKNHEKCDKAFQHDFSGLVNCDALVLLNPCGKSAHLETGFAIGANKPVFIYKHSGDPELMYLMANGIFDNLDDIIKELKQLQKLIKLNNGEIK